jgi:hypothetical protein
MSYFAIDALMPRPVQNIFNRCKLTGRLFLGHVTANLAAGPAVSLHSTVVDFSQASRHFRWNKKPSYCQYSQATQHKGPRR